MSFGFSVGDFLAAGELIFKVSCALHEAGGSAQQYRQVDLQLNSLKFALNEVDKLDPPQDLEATGNSIKAAALSCQLPLKQFLASIEPYDRSLGIGQSSGAIKDAARKIRWVATKKDDAVGKLRGELAGYVGSINMLLGLYQVKLKVINDRKSRAQIEALAGGVEKLGLVIGGIESRIADETYLICDEVKNSQQQASRVVQVFENKITTTFGDFLQSLGKISEVACNTYSTTLRCYNLLLSLQTNISVASTAHTWLQSRMRVEDPFGIPFPVPTEYDYAMLEAVIRARFREGKGKDLVAHDQWELFDTSNPSISINSNKWQFFPGMKITMAMILPRFNSEMRCPRPGCHSTTYLEAPGGGMLCNECGVWFDELSKRSPYEPIQILGEDYTTDLDYDSDYDVDYRSAPHLNGTNRFPYDDSEEDVLSTFSGGDLKATQSHSVDDSLRHLKNIRIRPVFQETSGDVRVMLPILQNRAPREGLFDAIGAIYPYARQHHEDLIDKISVALAGALGRLEALKSKHSSMVTRGSCVSGGSYCVALGGTFKPIPPREGHVRDRENDTVDLAASGIPVPAGIQLPARFECQFCYKATSVQSARQWNEHVHSDIQSYICTWPRCRSENPTFKTLTPWIRHENVHRQLEWWICQIDDCRHPCYRKPNFLQHLVREHKFPKPKQKTRAAILKAGHTEPVFNMIELCHHETQNRPQDEFCKFCGRHFNTWKEIIYHTAAHLEHLSLLVPLLLENRRPRDQFK